MGGEEPCVEHVQCLLVSDWYTAHFSLLAERPHCFVMLPTRLRHVSSLIPRLLSDFISQAWRKIMRRPGTNTTSRTGNGGLDSYVMWTRFHNDGNMPTQYAASTASDRTVKLASIVSLTATDFASTKLLTKDV